MPFQQKIQDSQVLKKILELVDSQAYSHLDDELKTRIRNFAKGESYNKNIEPDPHRAEAINILRILTDNDNLMDTYIQPKDYNILINKKLCEWIAKNVPFLQYKNQEDLMHLANFLYCSEYGYDDNDDIIIQKGGAQSSDKVAEKRRIFEPKPLIDPSHVYPKSNFFSDNKKDFNIGYVAEKRLFFEPKVEELPDSPVDSKSNFFSENKEDFHRMGRNLNHFLQILNSDSGFITSKNYTLIHDCELGDANAVLLFRYLQSINPQNKFKIIMQVSKKFKPYVLKKPYINFFYDQLVVDNSHDIYNINRLLCGYGNFENSLDRHASGKLAFLNDTFYESMIPTYYKNLESSSSIIKPASITKSGGKNKRYTKRRRHTKKRRRHTKRRY
jgi:hypothetical protein